MINTITLFFGKFNNRDNAKTYIIDGRSEVVSGSNGNAMCISFIY